jgi:ABC-type sugar transport system permease subunit
MKVEPVHEFPLARRPLSAATRTSYRSGPTVTVGGSSLARHSRLCPAARVSGWLHALLSVTDATGSLRFDLDFVGAQNYITALTDTERFWPAVGRTVVSPVPSVPSRPRHGLHCYCGGPSVRFDGRGR